MMEPDRTTGLYRMMLTSRRLEEAISKLWQEGHISGEMHLGIGEEGIVATIRFDPDVAWIAEREIGGRASINREPDGTIEATLAIGATGPLLSWLVGFADGAVIVDPPELVDQYIAMVEG